MKIRKTNFFQKKYNWLVSELLNSSGTAFILIYFFLDYNDYITNYSSSEPGNKDLIGISTINSPYAWCIKADNKNFNVTLNQVSYITGISFQGDSNTGSFIRSFRIKYLQKGSWREIHDVWYFLIFLFIDENFQLIVCMIYSKGVA